MTAQGDLTRGERVSITQFTNGEPQYLAGWIISVSPDHITISDSPDDDGRDDYDPVWFMRATFEPRTVYIYRGGATRPTTTTNTKETK